MKKMKSRVISRSVGDLMAAEGRRLKGDEIIRGRMDEFLSTWDGTLSPRVANRVAELLAEPQRDRSGSWSASSAGNCKRRQEFTFLGVPAGNHGVIDPRLNRIFLNGRWVHLRYQATLMEAEILDNIEVLVKRPKDRARCSMDGMGVARGGQFDRRDFGFELKGRNLFTFQSQRMDGADEKTRKQVDFMFLLSGLEVFVILNESKNDQDVTEWVFVPEDDRLKAIETDLKEMNRAIDIQRLHPMITECKERRGQWKQCPFGGKNGACLNTGSWI